MTVGHKLLMNGKEPCVQQAPLNGWDMSWNPDDGRFYVQGGQKVAATFKEWRNAVRYARTHQP